MRSLHGSRGFDRCDNRLVGQHRLGRGVRGIRKRWCAATAPFASMRATAGKEFDTDTGLYYFNARWYDPTLGRFITEDPARDGGNWFAYVGNNPMSRVDPTGLEYWACGNPEKETNPSVKIHDAGASPESYDPINTPIMRPTHEQAKNELISIAAVGLAATGFGAAAELGVAGVATAAISAGVSGTFSIGESYLANPSTALSDPATYQKAALSAGFASLTGPFAAGFTGLGVPLVSNPWVSTAISSGLGGMGNYALQSSLIDEMPVAGNKLLLSGGLSAVSGLAGKAAGGMIGNIGARSSTSLSGTYFDPFAKIVGSDPEFLRLPLLSTTTLQKPLAVGIGTMLVDPSTSEASNSTLNRILGNK